MTFNAYELLSSLPEGVDDPPPPTSPSAELLRILQQTGARSVPLSRFARFWILGSVHAKITIAYLSYWIRSGYAAEEDRGRRLNETHLKAAVELFGAMSYLRGSIMKVGQSLAAYPNLLPVQFMETLSGLHFEAPPMHYALIREFVRRELNADPEELFAEFETQAFAAASLGQVHRARLHSGERVAVKIQYPGIANTIEADFRNISSILAPMRLSRDWDVIRAQIEDARRMLLGETDYLREAALMERARTVFGAEEGIVIPRSFPQFSSQRVLTMEFLDGLHLDRYLATHPSQEQRDRYGQLIMRASFRIAHKARFWYADSNPGNYLFLGNGSLGLIDFGCCREFTAEEWDYYDQQWRYQQTGAGRREAMLRCAGFRPGENVDEHLIEFLDKCFHWWCDYMTVDEAFDFGDEAFMRRGLELATEMARKRYFRSMPVNMWITRQLLGLRTLAHRLQSRINMRRLGQDEAWGLPVASRLADPSR